MTMQRETDQPLWTPSAEAIAASNMMALIGLVRERHGVAFDTYDALHGWSVAHPELFWDAVWDFTGVIGEKGARILADGGKMPGA